MRLQTRQRIFYVFLLLFCVISAFVVLYADGWRIDLLTLEAQKAGGIYVRSFPEGADITLNGIPVTNQSGFLSPGTFVSGLFPKTYALTLSSPGYDAWTEDLAVTPTLVTELKYAVLVPMKASNVIASGTVTKFFEAGGDAVTQNTSGTITWRGKAIAHGEIVSHSTDLHTMIVRTSGTRSAAASYSLYDFTNGTSTSLSPALRAAGIPSASALNMFIDPYDDTGIIVQTKTSVTRIDADTGRTGVIDTAPAGTSIETPIAMSASLMAWARAVNASGTSKIIVYDKFSGDTIDSSLVVPGTVKQLAWIRNNELGVLENDNSLYVYNVSGEQLSKLADDVRQFYPSPDGNTIAALEYHGIEVFAERAQEYYRFNPPQTGDIQGLSWYGDNTHLFVQYPNRVSFLDLMDAGLHNFTKVADGIMPSYDVQSNSLYMIDPDGALIRFAFPR